MLFHDLIKNLAYVINGTEKLVGSYNDILASGMEKRGRLDLETIPRSIGTRTAQQTTYMVDMAKAEAMDCLGEQQAAIKLAERHL